MSRRKRPEPPTSIPSVSIPGFQVGDVIVIRGRVLVASLDEAALFPVETVTGGFVWVTQAECEAEKVAGI